MDIGERHGGGAAGLEEHLSRRGAPIGIELIVATGSYGSRLAPPILSLQRWVQKPTLTNRQQRSRGRRRLRDCSGLPSAKDRSRRVPSEDNDLLPTRCGDEQLLGALRIIARQYRGGSAKLGQKLVGVTLQTAIEEYDRRPVDMNLFQWLQAIMQQHLN